MIIFFLLSSINIININLASWQRGKEESGEEEGEKEEARRKRGSGRRATRRSRTAEPAKCQERTYESDTVAATGQSSAERTNNSQGGPEDHANIPH